MTSCVSCDNTVEVNKNRDQTIQVTLKTNGVAFDITGAKIWFSVKAELDNLDVDAVITKKNLAAGGSDSQASVVDGAAGILNVFILPADTVDIDPGDYWYDVVIETTDPKKLQAVSPSRFRILQPVTVT